MRAATIWVAELIRQKLRAPTALEIDNAIWLISQENDIQKTSKPYHRTRSRYY